MSSFARFTCDANYKSLALQICYFWLVKQYKWITSFLSLLLLNDVYIQKLFRNTHSTIYFIFSIDYDMNFTFYCVLWQDRNLHCFWKMMMLDWFIMISIYIWSSCAWRFRELLYQVPESICHNGQLIEWASYGVY